MVTVKKFMSTAFRITKKIINSGMLRRERNYKNCKF